jgi:hypothetical protein
MSIEPGLNFKAALVSTQNGGILPKVWRAINGHSFGETVLKPLFIEAVHIVRQSPSGGENHFCQRDTRKQHLEILHAPIVEDPVGRHAVPERHEHAVNV